MIWEANKPNDDTYNANEIHTQIHNDKEMIRERFECSDGSLHGHFEADSEDSGKHQASLVGWANIHSNWSEFESFTPKVTGSLHIVLSPVSSEGMYYIDDAGDPVKLFPKDHDYLEGRDDDDHPQYQDQSFSKAFTTDWKVKHVARVNYTDSGNSDALGWSHKDEDWETAHGAGTMGSRNFHTYSIHADRIVYEKRTASGYVTLTENGIITWPWPESNPEDGKFYALALRAPDNALGFFDIETGAVFPGTIGYGVLKDDS